MHFQELNISIHKRDCRLNISINTETVDLMSMGPLIIEGFSPIQIGTLLKSFV